MQVRVEGYDWSRCNGKQKKPVSFDQLNWEAPPSTPTMRTYAAVGACQMSAVRRPPGRRRV
ncbi:hypothetical protein [Streptomyces sp. HUAS ZL42]|uniref:hypothetical protein n=1 Tax=Streptomyces sp. HUAS ZL42 TaxID=3231715 RepID=UPI00345EA174